jgi:hypothetical protein
MPGRAHSLDDRWTCLKLQAIMDRRGVKGVVGGMGAAPMSDHGYVRNGSRATVRQPAWWHLAKSL